MTIAVDVSQVPAFLRGSLADADVEFALSWASHAVEAYCERDFSYYASETVLVDPFPASRSAQLPNPPVLGIASVEGYFRDSTGALSWQSLDNYGWTTEGLLYDTSGQPGVQVVAVPSWPALPKSLRVTYSHGFEYVPGAVVDATIKAAAGFLANPLNLISRKTGDVEYGWSVSMMQSAGVALDEALLAKYRLVTVSR